MAAECSTMEQVNKDCDELTILKKMCKEAFADDPSQAPSEATVRRYLRGFHTAENAHRALVKTRKWREEYGVAKITKEDEDVQLELMSGKADLLHHRDHKGRPVIYVDVGKHSVYERDINKLTKFTVYLLETACNRCDEDIIDNLCIIFDMKDFGIASMDYQFVKKLTWLLSKHFPERLGSCLILNSSMVFYGCWTIIKPWLDAVTANKVIFINDDTHLSEYIHADILPVEDDGF